MTTMQQYYGAAAWRQIQVLECLCDFNALGVQPTRTDLIRNVWPVEGNKLPRSAFVTLKTLERRGLMVDEAEKRNRSALRVTSKGIEVVERAEERAR